MLGFRSSFFKLNQPRKFEFPTRYYDAAKEDLHARIKFTQARLDAERNAENDAPTDRAMRMTQAFRQARRQASSPIGGGNTSLLLNPAFMRAIIGVLLLVGMYFFFYGDNISAWLRDNVFESIGGVLVAVLVLVLLTRLTKQTR